MNRLIIIGNGFDLAHGLKTRYSDFMLDYLKKAIETKARRNVDDELINFKGNTSFLRHHFDYLLGLDSIVEIFECFDRNSVSVEYKSPFVESLIKQATAKNWVDIENLYHQQLLAALVFYPVKSSRVRAENLLKQLNEQMNILKVGFVEYFTKIESDFKWNCNSDDSKDMLKIFRNNAAKKNNILGGGVLSTRVLNFNYTNVVGKYCKELDSEHQIAEIPLHGKLSDIESIVFGFGDEIHKSYKEIEDLDENLFFEHIKSFKYFQNEHYQDLMAFLETGKFEVFVLGHSLGLSDRTMLQAIFGSENLERVKLFYYKEGSDNNYTYMTHQLSRHFTDKNRMRKKVVSFNNSEPLPQFRVSK